MNVTQISQSKQTVRFLDVLNQECEATVDDDSNLVIDCHVPGCRAVRRVLSPEDVKRLSDFAASGEFKVPQSEIANVVRTATQQQQNN